jgi:hypothetical protein
MLRTEKNTILKLRVETTQHDIEEGKCRLATKCMEKLAVTSALVRQLKIPPEDIASLHVRVDAGHIKFNYRGFRWLADTPSRVKDWLIRFDRGETVRPHVYSIAARRTTEVIPFTKERQEQINLARQKRIREGRPDRNYTDPSIHQRVIGFALGN